jgi:hypothetical protein
MPNPTFAGEVMLAGWSETHNGGAKVTFFLPDASDLDAFRRLTVAKGKVAGHRFMVALQEIDDNEMPKPAPDPVKGGALAKLAGVLCSDPVFRAWLFDTRITCAQDESLLFEKDERGAAELVRSICGVSSRAELDHDKRAAEFFHEIIRKPWVAFSQGAST